jgi:hypothetical protein
MGIIFSISVECGKKCKIKKAFYTDNMSINRLLSVIINGKEICNNVVKILKHERIFFLSIII